MNKLNFLRPVPKEFKISSPYGRHRLLTINGITTSRPHWGIDFACPVGTPVRAPRAGIIQAVGWQNPMEPTQGYGLRVVLRFDDEVGPVFSTLAHLNEITVGARDHVFEGTIIGLSGNTGRSSGPHLHIDCRLANTRDFLDMTFHDEIPTPPEVA